jgi:hypothetical protein
MDKSIAVGFGSAQAYNEAGFFYDGENDLQSGNEPKTVGDIEAIAKADPDHDWRISFHGPLHGETYQRQGEGKWIMIESNEGFA